MQRRHSTSFIDTVPVKHDLSPYVPLLDVDGTLTIVGQLGPVAELNTFRWSRGAGASRDRRPEDFFRRKSYSTSARASASDPTAS